MSLAITHFLVGATILVWAMTFEPEYYDNDPLWWTFIGGLWAMGPDIAKFWPIFDPLHDNLILSSLFGLHGLLDVLDPSDSIVVGAIAVALFGATVLLTKAHGLR